MTKLSEQTGILSILNVGDGDTKLSFDPNDPGDAKRTAKKRERQAELKRRKQMSSPSRARQVADADGADGYRWLRNGLRRMAADSGDWAGIPLPLDDQRLVIEPTYPNAEKLMALGGGDDAPLTAAEIEAENDGWKASRLKCGGCNMTAPSPTFDADRWSQFAAAAMVGLERTLFPEKLAEYAALCADAMMVELRKREEVK